MKGKGSFVYLEGTSYEIGYNQGKDLSVIPNIQKMLFEDHKKSKARAEDTLENFNKYCPELIDELQGVSDYFNRDVEELRFLQDSYLMGGGCSLAAITPKMTVDEKMYVFRTYDLSPNISDMRLCSTNADNKYSHTGFSVSTFGRSDGLNEYGLCVTFASCGVPVGNHPGMLKAKVDGLNFMVVVRIILENCQTIEQAIDLFYELPIASNMNLLIADRFEKVAILEAYNGSKGHTIEESRYSLATNHALLEKVKIQEMSILKQSVVRYEAMDQYFSNKQLVTKGDMKAILKAEYPKGVSSLNYEEGFGTVHAALFCISDRTMEFSFGSPMRNEIYQIKVGDNMPNKGFDIDLKNNSYGRNFWDLME